MNEIVDIENEIFDKYDIARIFNEIIKNFEHAPYFTRSSISFKDIPSELVININKFIGLVSFVDVHTNLIRKYFDNAELYNVRVLVVDAILSININFKNELCKSIENVVIFNNVQDDIIRSWYAYYMLCVLLEDFPSLSCSVSKIDLRKWYNLNMFKTGITNVQIWERLFNNNPQFNDHPYTRSFFYHLFENKLDEYKIKVLA